MDLVTRSQWGASQPRSTTHLPRPHGIAVHWNGPAMGTRSHDRCPGSVKAIQRFHMNTRGWADIAYSFLICPHGVIYEGRGWGRRSAANGTNAGNTWGHAAMVMVGEGESIPADVYVSLARLNAEHRRLYGRSELRPHSSFKSTECPGPALTDWVRRNPSPAVPTTYQPPAPAPEEDDMSRYTVSQDDTGNYVKVIQRALLDWNEKRGRPLRLNADGVYGPYTRDAVSDYQKAAGLPVTGEVDPMTGWCLARYDLI